MWEECSGYEVALVQIVPAWIHACPGGVVLGRGLIPTGALARSKIGVARSASDVVGDDQFDVAAEVCPDFVGVVGLAIALMKYEVRREPSMTLLVGRWFMVQQIPGLLIGGVGSGVCDKCCDVCCWRR